MRTAAGSQHENTQHKQQLQDCRKLNFEYFLKLATRHLVTSETASTPSCSADYGEQYLRRWNKLQDSYCNTSLSSSAAETQTSISSSVACHAHPEADLATCAARNLVLQSSTAFLGSKDGIAGLPNPAAGSIRLSCKRTADPKAFLRGRLQSNEGSRMMLVQAPQFDVRAAEQARACSAARTIQHPVLFLMRVDPENAFHNLETVVSMFAALATLQLQPQQYNGGLEVVIADDRVPGYFSAVWRRLSHPHPLRVLREQPFPAGTCFATALLAPYTAHTQSLLTYKAGTADEVLCESVVLHATSLWLRHLFRDLLPMRPHHTSSTGGSRDAESHEGTASGSSSSSHSRASRRNNSTAPGSGSARSWRSSWYHYGAAAAADVALLQPSPTQSPLQLQQLHLLWLSRSRYERQQEQALSAWQRARQLPASQQEQLLVELQRAVLRWNEQTCLPGQQTNCSSRAVAFSLQVAELSELPFYPDQISLLMRTGVLMGVHGAGLANQVFMKPRLGAVVELWHNMENNFHYHNLAHMLGHRYFNVRSEQELDVPAVVAAAVAAMDAVAAARAAAAAAGSGSGSWWWRRPWQG
uniref:Uncharacterized protein n=1 Tax=Tetradesmus obliquus TaxID=3088 RepID=A0A383V844_TETOB|eukprot:jgi/Sobl393_1/9210/SZX60942.1